MGEVTSLVKRERKDRVSGLDRGEIHRHVRRAAAVRLYIRVVGPEQLACTLAGKLLCCVNRQATRIPALARISLGIFVHQHAACGKTDRA